jgi:uncharacterized membrane protein YedE/YeeE
MTTQTPSQTHLLSLASISEGARYLLAGTLFGIVAVKSQIISWYRIQEMFRFHSFHMYGVIGSAVLVGIVSVWLIKRFNVKTISGDPITFQDKAPTYPRYLVGGTIFGLGWALVGACPGPMLALFGSGVFSIIIVMFGAYLGTWLYGVLRAYLPH